MRPLSRLLLLLPLARLGPPAPAPIQAGGTSAAVDRIVLERLRRNQVAGAAVVVMSNGRVLKNTAYGFANRATGEKARPETAFFIASITKAFTAATVLGLVHDGRFRLEDSVGLYVRGLPPAWRGVTVRHLLGMTSGLPDAVISVERGISYPDYQTAIDSAAVKPLAHPPGGGHRYSMMDYVLLGQVVEAVTGRPFADAVAARVFQPLGLGSAAFGDSRDLGPGRAEWYSTYVPPDRFTAKPYLLRTIYPGYSRPNAGLFITAPELATFVDALASGRILDGVARETYWKPVLGSNEGAEGPTFGSWYRDDENPDVFWHEGGARAAVYLSRAKRLVVVVLTNTQGARPIGWLAPIAKLYSGG